jgi:hypothetical protein
MVVVEGAIPATLVTGAITMVITGILLNIAGLGLFLGTVHACRLCGSLFRWHHRRFYLFQAGTGPFGAIVIGFVAARAFSS